MNNILPDANQMLRDPAEKIRTQASGVFVLTVGLALLLFLGWASIAKLDRVTRGSGRIVSQEKNSVLQHYEGGIITQLLVAEGDGVKAGDTLMRIENSFATAELASSKLALQTQRLNRVRLMAEASGAENAAFSDQVNDAAIELINQQTRMFESRKRERRESLAILDDQIAQKQLELSEKRSRFENKSREQSLMSERLDSLRQLSKEGAVARNELLQNETQFQQLLTQISDLEYQILQTQSALKEGQGRRREAELSYRTEAERELTETDFEIAKLKESIAALNDRKTRFDVTAPITGKINKLFVSTVNGVVRPGQNLAEIVPENAPIAIEAKISPRDRAKVYPGLRSLVKVSAYDYTQYGGLEGKVIEISPDALQDEQGNVYFRVRIEANADALGGGNLVVPGMLAEVDIISGQQTVMDYLLKPIRKIQANAFRE